MECQLENISVNFEMFGEGRPIVLLHGYWTDHRQIAGCMEPNFESRDGWKRIYPDLPGMGKTLGSERTVPPQEILIKDADLVSKLTPEEREEFEHWVWDSDGRGK